MLVIELIFWLSASLLIFAYGGYTIFILPFRRRRKIISEESLPSCTFLIAAFNEGRVIAEKLENSIALHYPSHLVRIMVVADGSNDQTVSICGSYPSVTLLFEPERRGKIAAIQRALHSIDSDVIVFSDANTLLNIDALLLLARHFADQGVGAVSGEKQVLNTGTDAATESVYWKYESWLKSQDAAFYSLVGAAGELFAVRRDLYTMIPEDTILDDFTQSMLVATSGHIVAYEPLAVATELPSTSLRNEFERKVRIAAGGFQAMQRLAPRISFLKQPKLTYLYYSHRVLRWTIAPIMLFLLLPLNIILATGSTFYQVLLVFHGLAYVLAIVGNDISIYGKRPGLLKIPSYLFFMNLAVFFGFKRFLLKQQSASWEKIPRL